MIRSVNQTEHKNYMGDLIVQKQTYTYRLDTQYISLFSTRVGAINPVFTHIMRLVAVKKNLCNINIFVGVMGEE